MEKKKAESIPYHSLNSTNDIGIELRRIENFEIENIEVYKAHRDAHYIFIVQEKGNAKIFVDFNEIDIEGNSIFYIRPSQVHYSISIKKSKAWLIAVDNELVSNEAKYFLDDYVFYSTPNHIKPTYGCRVLAMQIS